MASQVWLVVALRTLTRGMGSLLQALIAVYNSTLDEVKKMPETAVYRTHVEKLTESRLQIVQNVSVVHFPQTIVQKSNTFQELLPADRLCLCATERQSCHSIELPCHLQTEDVNAIEEAVDAGQIEEVLQQVFQVVDGVVTRSFALTVMSILILGTVRA